VLTVSAVDRYTPDVNPASLRPNKLQGGFRKIHRDADFMRPEIGGPSRQHTNRDLCPDNAIDDFADGSIATTGDDNIKAFRSGIFREFRRVPTMELLPNLNVPSVRRENWEDGCQINPSLPRTGIGNETGANWLSHE